MGPGFQDFLKFPNWSHGGEAPNRPNRETPNTQTRNPEFGGFGVQAWRALQSSLTLLARTPAVLQGKPTPTDLWGVPLPDLRGGQRGLPGSPGPGPPLRGRCAGAAA